MLSLATQGVFWTVQGEGHYIGVPMIFVRLAGCSVGCASCDTNYRWAEDVAENAIVDRCHALREQHRRAEYVWITGGEPTDQSLTALSKALWRDGFKPCLATSGIRPVVDQWWWLSVSPHWPQFAQRAGAELKLVPGLNGLRLCDVDLDECFFSHCYVQPMAGDRKSLAECLEWVKDRPYWRLSPQCHKQWGVP